MLEVVLRVGVPLEQILVTARELVLHLSQRLFQLGEMRSRAAGMLLDRAVHVDEELLLQEADARAVRERDRPAVGRVETGDDP